MSGRIAHTVGGLLGASEGKILGPALRLVLGTTESNSDGVGVEDLLSANDGRAL